jgi:hypothetical protein
MMEVGELMDMPVVSEHRDLLVMPVVSEHRDPVDIRVVQVITAVQATLVVKVTPVLQ